MDKFLIIQTAFIGDVVLATAVAEHLHNYYPTAQIDFVLRKGNESLLTNHPFITNVWVWDKKQDKYGNLFKVLLQVRSQKYNAVINLQRFAATGLLTVFSGAKRRIGFDKNPLSFLFDKRITHSITAKHEIDRNLDLVKSFTGFERTKPKLYPSPTDFSNIQAYTNKPYVCIAPSSVWFTKQFPAEKWIAFIRKVDPNTPIYLLGAASDTDLCENIAKQSAHPNVHNLCGKLSFLESAALMQGAIMNYVNDSAPLHFASAVNAPVTAIYCSTIPEFGFGPLSDNSAIVQTAVELSCRPCGLHGRKVCPEGHFKCATTIATEQLVARLNK